MSKPELIVILPAMTVAEIAKLCERHDAYVRIESNAGKVYAYMEANREADHIPVFLRRQAE